MGSKKINLAIQGGGAHGAFTWGILDKFLETSLFTIDGISATSAGSMNAIVLAQGLMENDDNDAARQLLYDFWKKMSDYGKIFNVTARLPIDSFLEPYIKEPVLFYLFNTITNLYSPYQLNPSNYHPIREILNSMIDIEKIKKHSKINLFICATNIKTGKIHIFSNNELSIDAILASACLPKVFHAVEINGEHYWDGGYLGDPAIFPLIYNTECRDIIILHTVPIVRETLPTTTSEIDLRLREISFNSSLMREMRAIAFVTKLIDNGWIKPEFENNLKKIYVHCIRADDCLKQYPLSTVFTPDWDFLIKLRDLGRKAAEKWITENYESIGKNTTIDFEEWL